MRPRARAHAHARPCAHVHVSHAYIISVVKIIGFSRGIPGNPLETFTTESFHNQDSAEVLETGRPSCGWAKSR